MKLGVHFMHKDNMQSNNGFFFLKEKKNRKKENVKKIFHTYRKLSGAITLISLHNSSKPNWVSGLLGL